MSISACKDLEPTTKWLLCMMLYHRTNGGPQWKRQVSALSIHRGANTSFATISGTAALLFCRKHPLSSSPMTNCFVTGSSFGASQRTRHRKNQKKTKRSGLGECFSGGKLAKRAAGRLYELKKSECTRVTCSCFIFAHLFGKIYKAQCTKKRITSFFNPRLRINNVAEQLV